MSLSILTTVAATKGKILPKITGVADHPNKDLMEDLWRNQGMRAKKIITYLEEHNLPTVSYKALGKYGQRNWTEKKEGDLDLTDLDIKLQEAEDLGIITRISLSKTGYSISVTPKLPDEQVEILQSIPKAPRKPSKKSKSSSGNVTHVIIPDTQVEPGRPIDHLWWASAYINDHVDNDVVRLIHLGDHWNMGSLSSYDRGKGYMEGRRYLADINSGNEGFKALNCELVDKKFDKHFLFGNHENRINKAVENDIQLDGLLTTEHCDTMDWQRHNFLDIVDLDGIAYSHYFYNPTTSKPYGGEIEGRLKTIGRSFVMGHQQGLKFAARYIQEKQQIGIAAGSFYEHQEHYMGPQGTGYWRGIIVLHDIDNGSCENPQFISIEKLKRMYA